MDHIQELKSRLFWIAIYFIAFSGAAYAFFPEISKLLISPLGNEQLYYMTPAGGLSFILKVCMYVGLIACLPVITYHLYRFVAPVIKKTTIRSVLIYTISSILLAMIGIGFAYVVSLPAALHFLTTVAIDHVSAMLTIDSYVSFVTAYILAGALLFQLPLVMLIIDSTTPLPPGRLMGYQRHMIIVSFVLAALVSPTPDVVNQTLLAAPIVVMYQLGIIMIAWRHAVRRRRQGRIAHVSKKEIVHAPLPASPPAMVQPKSISAHPAKVVTLRVRPSVDGMSGLRSIRQTPAINVPARTVVLQGPRATISRPPRRSIDGILG